MSTEQAPQESAEEIIPASVFAGDSTVYGGVGNDTVYGGTGQDNDNLLLKDETVKKTDIASTLLIDALKDSVAQPFTNGAGVAFSRFTLPRASLDMDDAQISDAVRKFSALRITPAGEEPKKQLNEHGLPSSHEFLELPKRPVYAGRNEKGNIEVTVPGKYDAFPAGQISSALQESQERNR